MKTRCTHSLVSALAIPRAVGRCCAGIALLVATSGVVHAQESATSPDIESLEASEARLKQMEEEVMKSLAKSPAKGDSGAISLPSAPAKPSKAASPEIVETSLPTTPKEALVKLDRKSPPPSTLKQLEKDLSHTPEKPKVVRVSAEKGDVEQKLEIAESQVSILTRELNTMRKSLESSERRVEELVRINRAGGERQLAARRGVGEYDTRGAGISDEDPASMGDANYDKGHTVPISNSQVSPLQDDGRPSSSDFATVVSHRAPLRTGPGRFESALMMVPRDSVVSIELRTGNWYRVITPGGNRGWIAGESLEFQMGTDPDSAVRVGPVRMAYEPTGLKY